MKVRNGFVSNSSSSSFIISAKKELTLEDIKNQFLKGIDLDNCLFSGMMIGLCEWFYKNLEKVNLRERYEYNYGAPGNEKMILESYSADKLGLPIKDLHSYQLSVANDDDSDFSRFLYENSGILYNLNFGPDIAVSHDHG